MMEYNSVAFLYPEQSTAGGCPQIYITFNDMALFRLGKIHSSRFILRTTQTKVSYYYFFFPIFYFKMHFLGFAFSGCVDWHSYSSDLF